MDGITRLNSTQVFAGMPPIKIAVTALFRAWKDPAKEVEAPFNQLMSWALPAELSDLGPILSRATDYAAGEDLSAVEVLAPSIAPAKIAMTYKGKTYAPSGDRVHRAAHRFPRGQQRQTRRAAGADHPLHTNGAGPLRLEADQRRLTLHAIAKNGASNGDSR